MSEEIIETTKKTKVPAEKAEMSVVKKAEKPKAEKKPATEKLALKAEKSEKPAKPVAEKAAPISKVKSTNNGNLLKITLVKSTIGCSIKQKRTIEALGLKKIRSLKVHNDSATLQGMLTVVKHLVAIEAI